MVGDVHAHEVESGYFVGGFLHLDDEDFGFFLEADLGCAKLFLGLVFFVAEVGEFLLVPGEDFLGGVWCCKGDGFGAGEDGCAETGASTGEFVEGAGLVDGEVAELGEGGLLVDGFGDCFGGGVADEADEGGATAEGEEDQGTGDGEPDAGGFWGFHGRSMGEGSGFIVEGWEKCGLL